MTENLPQLLLRRSDAGPQVLSGRTLRRWLGRPIEALLGRRVLVETEPVTEWAPCASCDQGCDSRPILTQGDRRIAACPHDSRRDEELSEDDVRAFEVDVENLYRAIREDTGLGGDGTLRIGDAAWSLGTLDRPGQSPLAVLLVFDLQTQDVGDLVLLIRNRLRLDVVIVSTTSPPPMLREQLAASGMSVVDAADSLAGNDDSRPFALDRQRLVRPVDRTPARLVVRTAERTVMFEGHSVSMAPQPFGLLVLLVRRALTDRAHMQKRDIEDVLYGAAIHGDSVTDIVRRLRDAFAPLVGGAAARALIENKPRHGYRLALHPHEIDLL